MSSLVIHSPPAMQRSTNIRPGESPYLTHVVTHHGQVTLIPPQNAGRVRKLSPARSARNHNLNDSTSSLSSAGRLRSSRSGIPIIRRPDPPLQQVALTVPDFPPPSFQEAISSPVYRVPAQASLSVTSFSTYYSVPPRSPSELSYPTTSASTEGSIYEDADDDGVADDDISPSGSDSGGLEILSLDASQTEWEDDRRQGLSLDDRVRREIERRQLAEGIQPSAAPSMLSRQKTCSHCGAARREAINGDGISIVAIPASSPTAEQRNDLLHVMRAPSTRHRFLLKHNHSQSMSSASVPSTPVSARDRPSFRSNFPSADQHRRSRSMSPTRRSSSTTSSISRKPSLSFVSRKLFQSKGKTRSVSEEPLESWEVLESTPGGSCQNTEQPQVSRLRKTLSKMSLATMGTLSSTLDSPRAPTVDPYPMQHSSAPQVPSEKHSPKAHLPPIQNRPVPPIPTLLQHQPIRPPPPAPPSLRTHSPLATSSSPALSVSSSYTEPESSEKSRRPPPPPPPSRKNAPPVNTAIAQRGTRQRYQSMSIPSIASKVSFPSLSPTRHEGGGLVLNTNGYRGHPFSPSPLQCSSYVNCHSSELTYVTDEGEKSPSKSSSLSTIRPLIRDAPYGGSQPSPQTPTSPISRQSSSPSSRSGHHYPGRPLPLPPAGSPTTATPISATTFPFGDEKAILRFVDAQQNAAIVSQGVDFHSTPTVVVNSQVHFPTCAPLSPSPSSAATSRSSMTEVEMDQDKDDGTEAMNSEITEFDILVSRIDDSNQGGNYEDLLLVSEVLGRGNPALQTESSKSNRDKEEKTPFVGRIEVERRRVLKDGRVKVKLSLLGVGVDKCGVCLSQFKNSEMAALSQKCQHAYHEGCLKTWLQESNACPLCRGPLDKGGI